MSPVILVAVLLLAYSNGANDNFKGVATLFGSATTSYRRALSWATVTTLAGSLLSLLLAKGLVAAFTGKGLVPDSAIAQPAFLLAVSLGGALTVLVATWAGLPVSTTHALTGALVGAGLLATGGAIRWTALLSSFAVPLLMSPLLSMLATLVLYPVFRLARRSLGITRQSCVCVGDVSEPMLQPGGAAALNQATVVVETGQAPECAERYEGRMLGLEASAVLDALHFLSAGTVGFARGLNDTPKIVALLLASRALNPNPGLALVAVVMAVGGVLNARRVAETMSRKITRMNAGQGFTANLVTSSLVILASLFSMPVSTTHVSVGALFGIGTANRTARKDQVFIILLAWITTLPLGALLAGMTYWMFR